MPTDLYIGLMSGTSLDGIDAALLRFTDAGHQTELLARHEHPFPDRLRSELESIIRDWATIDRKMLARPDRELGELYAEAVHTLLTEAKLTHAEIVGIGCHGQTVCHRPDADPPFTVQLGDGALLARKTGITVVNDFRSADIALGGQGAPLAPAFHEWAFAGAEISAVVNIGGIGNITVLDPDAILKGYDTGPGNTLLDAWAMRHIRARFDRDGEWARSGRADAALLRHLLADPYFAQQPPKSTGREHFNLAWLDAQLRQSEPVAAPDVQATLVELTASTIATAARDEAVGAVYVCGGGARNTLLMERLGELLDPAPVETTDVLGVPAEWVEAAAFAWLAKARLANTPAGRPSVTGARDAALLGRVHLPAET